MIPNRQVWSSTITDFIRAKVRRGDVELSVPYGTDLAQVERLVRYCIEADERILARPAPLIHFGEIGESTISFWIGAWIETNDVDDVSIVHKQSIAERLEKTGVDSGFQTV